MSNRQFTLLMATTVFVFVVIIAMVNYGVFEFEDASQLAKMPNEDVSKSPSTTTKKTESPGPDYVNVGGVWRKNTDVKSIFEKTPTVVNYEWTKRIGQTPLVSKAANKATQSVADAVSKNENPERLSTLVQPDVFDLDKYLADPELYINTVEPGRIYQTKPPSEDITPIRRMGDYVFNLIQGETVALRVKVIPEMPVTFYSTKVGVFENSLKVITVRANADGVAEVQYTANKGTVGDIDIVAASPVHSHQAKFLVRVELPRPIVNLHKEKDVKSE